MQLSDWLNSRASCHVIESRALIGWASLLAWGVQVMINTSIRNVNKEDGVDLGGIFVVSFLANISVQAYNKIVTMTFEVNTRINSPPVFTSGYAPGEYYVGE